MRINTKLPMAIHILALLAMNKSEERPNTSELVAKSVGTNPVVVRRIMGQLRRAQLIRTRPGVPGAELLRPIGEITMLDVYKAVRTEEDEPIFDIHPNPAQVCPIGRNIHSALHPPLTAAQKAMESELAAHTIEEVVESIYKSLGK